MAYLHVLVVLAFTGLCLGDVGERCRRVSGCDCGEQCVDTQDLTPCQESEDTYCACIEGCAVAEVFIPAGITRFNTYGNTCGCPPRGSYGSNGIPMCTKMMWQGLPSGIPLYYDNPNCGAESGAGVFSGQSRGNDDLQGFYAGREKKSWRYPPKRIVTE